MSSLLAQIERRRRLEKICGKPKAASRQGALDFGAPAKAPKKKAAKGTAFALFEQARVAAAKGGLRLPKEFVIDALRSSTRAPHYRPNETIEVATQGGRLPGAVATNEAWDTARWLRSNGYVTELEDDRGWKFQITGAGQEVLEQAPKKQAAKKKAVKKKAPKKKAAKKKATKKGPSKAALWWLSVLNTAALDLATKPELKRTASKGGAYFGNAKEKRGVRELVEHKLARITLEEPASKGSVAAIYALPTPAGLRAYRDGAYAKHGKAAAKKPRGKKRAASTLRMDDKIRVKRWGSDTTTDARIYSVFPKGKMQIDFELEDAEGDRFMWSAGPSEKVEVIG